MNLNTIIFSIVNICSMLAVRRLEFSFVTIYAMQLNQLEAKKW